MWDNEIFTRFETACGFIIDKDHLFSNGIIENDHKGMVRIHNNANKEEVIEIERMLKASPQQGMKFKLYDDDGELYYSGRYIGSADEEYIFSPLEWATWDAGCTEMKYKHMETGEWKTL